ncbi:MAG: hypothetical protein ACR2N7_04605 [Acidimicrobiia bacterium]
MIRSRYTSVLLLIIATISVAAAACSDGGGSDEPVEGIVTQVTGELGSVETFIVLDDHGNSHLFTPEPGLLFYGGPLDHLRDHIVSGQRVVVTYESSAYGNQTAVLILHADADAPHEHGDAG